MTSTFRRIFAAVAGAALFADSASGASILQETDHIVGGADLIVIAHVPEIIFGSEKIPSRDGSVETVHCTATVAEVLKGDAPRSIRIVQRIMSDCDRVLLDGDWIVFLKREKDRFVVCSDPMPIKDQKAEWYTAHYRWPEKPVEPVFTYQPLKKVAQDIRAIARRLKTQ